MNAYVFFVNETNGAVTACHRYDGREQAPEGVTPPDGHLLYRSNDDSLGQVALQELTANIEGGQVLSLQATPTNNIYLHIDVSGGDGQDPPGVLDDGTQAVAVNVSLRSGQAEDSPVLPVAGTWRIMVRDSSGGEYDQVAISLVDGVAAINYVPPMTIEIAGQARAKIGDLRVLEQDLDASVSVAGVDYRVRLAKPVRFKVYRPAV